MLSLPFSQAVQRTLRHLGKALDVKAPANPAQLESSMAKVPMVSTSNADSVVSVVSVVPGPKMVIAGRGSLEIECNSTIAE